MKLFVLEAQWTDQYRDPDGMRIDVHGSDVIAYATDREMLKPIEQNLQTGFRGKQWTKKRADEIRRLYPEHDDMRDITYVIRDVTKQLIQNERATC